MDDRHAWERPGAHEVGAGVFRIPLPLPGDHLKAVNIYAILDGDGVVLIDGGWALEASEQQLAAGLTCIDRSFGDIREFLVTHVHRDHYTQAVALRRKFGIKVSLGEAEKITLDAVRTAEVHPEIARMAAAGAAELAHLLASDEFFGTPQDLTDFEDPDRWLTHQLELPLQSRTIRVLSTPGHTRGHVVFYDEQANALFAGDHVLPHITPSIGVEFIHSQSPLRDYLESLLIVKALPDATLLPAHGPAGSSTHASVEELLAHHDQRLEETAEAVDTGATTAFEVAKALGWTRHKRQFDTLDTFNQILAVNETVAHLEVLVERGALRSVLSDNVRHYLRA